MLTHLNIKGLAVVDSLTIDFGAGFNVITGETGAGKSILIKALNILLGAKSSADTVRTGCDAAVVCGQFVVQSSHTAVQVLVKLGIINPIEDGEVEILLRRQVTAKNRSQAWINDVPVSGATLRELGGTLIDLFAQHDNHRLLNPSEHIHYLDQFLPQQRVKNLVSETYQSAWVLYKEILKLVERYTSDNRDRDYLTFRLSELRDFAPDVNDYDKCLALVEKGEKCTEYGEALSGAQEILDSGSHGESLGRALRNIARLLSAAGGAHLNLLSEKAQEFASGVDELSYELARQQSGIEIDQSELDASVDRVGAYKDLMRRLGASDVSELVVRCEELEAQLESLENFDQHLYECISRLHGATSKLLLAAKELHDLRLEAAQRVKKIMEKELRELAMPGACIEVELTQQRKHIPAIDIPDLDKTYLGTWDEAVSTLADHSEYGSDKCQFLLQSNPGEAALPLHKVASGGEVSRIMLAVKRALAAGAETCLLVFDEIDTGISGKVADIVGRKIKDLAQDFQVICISHLPQVAAYGDNHFLVSKTTHRGRTESSITRLEESKRHEELARMISGTSITKTSIQHARELVRRTTDSQA